MSANSSSHDDGLDLDNLDLTPPKAKAKTAESDFEKELEALFAEELASSDEKPASAPPVGGPELEEEALLLDDLVADAPPAQDAGTSSICRPSPPVGSWIWPRQMRPLAARTATSIFPALMS